MVSASSQPPRSRPSLISRLILQGPAAAFASQHASPCPRWTHTVASRPGAHWLAGGLGFIRHRRKARRAAIRRWMDLGTILPRRPLGWRPCAVFTSVFIMFILQCHIIHRPKNGETFSKGNAEPILSQLRISPRRSRRHARSRDRPKRDVASFASRPERTPLDPMARSDRPWGPRARPRACRRDPPVESLPTGSEHRPHTDVCQ